MTVFFTINNISISVKRSNFTMVFFKAASHANLNTVRKRARSSSYILRHIFQIFLNASPNNNVSL